MSDLTRNQRKLLDRLIELAEIGEPIPPLPALERWMGTSNGSVAYLLERLQVLGHISLTITGTAPRANRVVTILATGKSTATPRRHEVEAARPIPSVVRSDAKPAPSRVDLIRAAAAKVQAARSVADTPTERHPAARAAPPAPVELAPVHVVEGPVTAAAIVEQGEPVITIPAPPAPAIEEQPAMPLAADQERTFVSAAPGLNADVAFVDGEIVVTVWLSTDPGPMRSFRPFITFPLDEAHALQLGASAMIALNEARQAREAA